MQNGPLIPDPKLKSKGECENVVYPAGRGAHQLAMKNGLPYLSKELFWLAMPLLKGIPQLTRKGMFWKSQPKVISNAIMQFKLYTEGEASAGLDKLDKVECGHVPSSSSP